MKKMNMQKEEFLILYVHESGRPKVHCGSFCQKKGKFRLRPGTLCAKSIVFCAKNNLELIKSRTHILYSKIRASHVTHPTSPPSVCSILHYLTV